MQKIKVKALLEAIFIFGSLLIYPEFHTLCELLNGQNCDATASFLYESNSRKIKTTLSPLYKASNSVQQNATLTKVLPT